MSDRIATLVPADLEGEGDPEFRFQKKCRYCGEKLRLNKQEWIDHTLECEEALIKRMKDRQPTYAETEIRKQFADLEAVPTVQSNSVKAEQIYPWLQDSFIGVIIRPHATRLEGTNILLPANLDDLSPELRTVMQGANTCRIVKVTDNFSRDERGNYLWPRLKEVKEQMENGKLGPKVKYLQGAGQVFPDSEGRACILLQCRYVYGEIEGSQDDEVTMPAVQVDIAPEEQPDVKITRGSDFNSDLSEALASA